MVENKVLKQKDLDQLARRVARRRGERG
jgi:hypothetical protein